MLTVVQASAAGAELPGIVRDADNVFLIENHSTSYIVWHALNITNATLIHIDTHDDCRFIPAEKMVRLKELNAERDYDRIFRLSDIGSSFQFKVNPKDLLYDLGNFIYACLLDGTVSTFYWVVPNKVLDDNSMVHLQAHLEQALRLESPKFSYLDGGGFSFNLRGARIIVTTLTHLPQIEPGALLDFDIDFFAFPVAMTDNHLTRELIWDPTNVCRTISRLVPQPRVVTVCASVWGGYLPMMMRFIADGCFEYFADGKYPADAIVLQAAVEKIRCNPVLIPPPPATGREVVRTRA